MKGDPSTRGSLRWHDPDRFDGFDLSRDFAAPQAVRGYDGNFQGVAQVLGLRVRLPTLADAASALLHVALSSDLDRRPFSPFAPQQFTVKNNGFTMRLPPQRRPSI